MSKFVLMKGDKVLFPVADFTQENIAARFTELKINASLAPKKLTGPVKVSGIVVMPATVEREAFDEETQVLVGPYREITATNVRYYYVAETKYVPEEAPVAE